MEVNNDWEAVETQADEDIPRFKADKENARKQLEMAEQRVSQLKADLEIARKGLEMAEERKKLSAERRKRKADWITDEVEAMKRLRLLSGHLSLRTDAS